MLDDADAIWSSSNSATSDAVPTTDLVPSTAGIDQPAMPPSARPWDASVALCDACDFVRNGEIPGLDSVAVQMRLLGSRNETQDIPPVSAKILKSVFDRSPPFTTAASYLNAERELKSKVSHVELSQSFSEEPRSVPCGLMCKCCTPSDARNFHERLIGIINGIAKEQSPNSKASYIACADLVMAWQQYRSVDDELPCQVFFVNFCTGLGQYYRFRARTVVLLMDQDRGVQAA